QELFAQQEDDNIAYEELYETLFLYYQNPVNLNKASREELATLFILSDIQINNLLQHIEKNGKLLSIYELQAVEGFDLLTIYKLVPFVQVPDAGLQADQRPLWQRIIGEDNNSLIIRWERTLQQRKGFSPPDPNSSATTRYLGSPDKVFARYRNSHYNDSSIGVTVEKDAGEQFVWDSQTKRYGFDFYSAHLQLYNKGRFKTLAVGDYQLQFGQGLLLSSGFVVGKGGETINTTSRSNIGIRPYSSVLESNFFRGAAATYSLSKQLELTGFYSRKKVDASLQTTADTLEPVGFFSSIQVTGFHRTPSELANKHQVQEQNYGGNLSYKSQNSRFTGGLTFLRTAYNRPLLRNPAPYQLFEFTGTINHSIGLNYSYYWQNLSFFGEVARSASGGVGVVNGVMASLSTKAEVALVYRHYQRDFHSFYGNAFSEGTRNVNEEGLYVGVKVRPIPKWEITAYYDKFRFPWLRYRVDAPSDGSEYLFRVYYRPNKQASLYSQFRTENKDRNDPAVRAIDFVTRTSRRSYLFYYDYSPTRSLNFKSRVQFSSFEQGSSTNSTGFLIAQDVSLDLGRVRLSTRYAIFDTDDYDTRQYVLEKDVLYAFSVPAFSGRGTRMYALVQLKPTRRSDFWFRIAHTHYRDQSSVGTGLESIEGPRRTDVKAQVRYKF
ncbi:MAG: helix-hairpin-helix domain-containing protein, partial [Hymenobacteraceae bacterium]|nr:helix-hairpin-helix domain-containing protein [Hymenobacteraceae bacterium]MDX5397807.1 helix-hairpin-helix domain-containing protein [Hymenobacteraceae bacterium]MDX5513886.1 helix-hairpin-helix domain-containing protein [Hymenobacteraceae bacterium]